MRKAGLSVFIFISTFSAAVHADNFLENDLLVQLHNLQDVEEMHLGAYYYYTCDNCSRSYQSQPSSCSRCGNTSFSRHDQSPGAD